MGTELDLEELGKRLGMVDRHLIALVLQRLELAKAVERYKRTHGQPIIRFRVEEERLAASRALAKEKGIDPNFIHSLFYLIIAETCRVQINQLQTAPETEEDVSPQQLKENLLALTQEIAPLYDQTYGQDFFATRLYLKFEASVLQQEIGTLKALNNLGLAIDLGCATGKTAFELAGSFSRVTGYDISPAMIEQAKNKLADGNFPNVEFKIADIEERIPEANDSASLVVMNLGTASDVIGIRRVLVGIKRVLKPDGRFFLSFYNAGALLYNCWFLPWPVSLAARMNYVKHCLDVRLKNKVFSIPARPYSVKEVKKLLQQNGLAVSQIFTHPTISSVLPNEFFEEASMQRLIEEIDRQLAKLNTGAYLIVTGRKVA